MNSRIRLHHQLVRNPDARPDAIAWFEYSDLTVAKISDCVIVRVDIYQNNGRGETDCYKDTPDQIRTGVAGSKVLHD